MEELRSNLAEQSLLSALLNRVPQLLRAQLAALRRISSLRLSCLPGDLHAEVEDLNQRLDSVNQDDAEGLQIILEEVTVLFDQVSHAEIQQCDSWTMTAAEAENYSDDEEDVKQESEWEAEILAIKV